MQPDAVPLPDGARGHRPALAVPIADKLLLDIADLAALTSLSVRTLRRMDACRDIPGRVAVGRRVLFRAEAVREWVRAGLPDRDRWAALQGPARR